MISRASFQVVIRAINSDLLIVLAKRVSPRVQLSEPNPWVRFTP